MQANVSKKKNNIQYPPQTGAYKVFVKDKGIWQKHGTARLQISVGNPKHTGDKFFALTEWAAARFDKVILIVSDTLQRHNLAMQHGISIEEAHGVSLINGQRWLKENKAALDNLAPYQRTVTLWDEWMSHADYAVTHAELMDIYARSADLRNSVESKAMEFCLRHEGQDAEQQQKAVDTSIAYILEEVAAFAIMFRETRAIDVYPGSWFSEVFDVIKSESPSSLMDGFSTAECLRVDFTRNKGLILV